MLRLPCSGCGNRQNNKMASLYWAWNRADGVRTAWKQKLCVDCTLERLASLLEHSQDSNSDVTTCPSCGTDSSNELDPIYLTLYVPKRERTDWGFTTCAACAAQIRVLVQKHATRLADRQEASSSDSSVSAWDALGLAPQA